MKNKKWIILIIIILLTQGIAFAHPGRLDSSGGHWDRKNGTYHFHSGNSTNRSHYNSSSVYEPYTSGNTPSVQNPKQGNKPKKSSAKTFIDYLFDHFDYVILIGFVLWFFHPLGIIFFEEVIYPLFNPRKAKILNAIRDAYNLLYKNKEYLLDIQKMNNYINNPPNPIVLPEYLEIQDNRLKAKDGITSINTTTGKKTLNTPLYYYVSKTGNHLHIKPGCSKVVYRVNILTTDCLLRNFSPCGRCCGHIDRSVLSQIKSIQMLISEHGRYKKQVTEYKKRIEYIKSQISSPAFEINKLMQLLASEKKYINNHSRLLSEYNLLLYEYNQISDGLNSLSNNK